MPLNNPAPNFALLTAWDMRSLSGLTLYTRNSNNIVMPTFSAGEGVYDDVLFFLNGRISSSTVYATGQLLTSASFGSASSWAMSIDSTDHVQIISDTAFTVTSTGTTDSLGFGASTVASVTVGSDQVATAPNQWTRGLVDLSDISYRIDEAVGVGTFNTPAIGADIQDVSVFMRAAGSSDADDFGLTSLQSIDNTAAGVSVDDITWCITEDGFAQCRYRTSLGDITWVNTTLRNQLGFTGDEVAVIDGTVSRLTSTIRIHGALLPTRPYQSHHLVAENISQSRRKISGGYVSNYIGTYNTSVLRFDLDALLDSHDDYQRFCYKFLSLCSSGERINFYQAWGDSRRALITADVNAEQSAYDSVYTSEENGGVGRIRGTLTTADFDLSYASRLKRKVPVNLEVEHL